MAWPFVKMYLWLFNQLWQKHAIYFICTCIFKYYKENKRYNMQQIIQLWQLQHTWTLHNVNMSIVYCLLSQSLVTFQITWAESFSEIFYMIAGSHYYHLPQSYWDNFNQTWHRKVKRIQNYTNKGSHPFPMGDNSPPEPLGLEWRGFKFVQTEYHLILKNFLLLMNVMI